MYCLGRSAPIAMLTLALLGQIMGNGRSPFDRVASIIGIETHRLRQMVPLVSANVHSFGYDNEKAVPLKLIASFFNLLLILLALQPHLQSGRISTHTTKPPNRTKRNKY